VVGLGKIPGSVGFGIGYGSAAHACRENQRHRLPQRLDGGSGGSQRRERSGYFAGGSEDQEILAGQAVRHGLSDGRRGEVVRPTV